MKRYVDANKMLRFLTEHNEEKDLMVSRYNADWIISFIETQPTADVVEVVRCKDCLYSYFNTANETFSCQRIYPRRWVQEDDYCNYAKKQEVSERCL